MSSYGVAKGRKLLVRIGSKGCNVTVNICVSYNHARAVIKKLLPNVGFHRHTVTAHRAQTARITVIYRIVKDIRISVPALWVPGARTCSGWVGRHEPSQGVGVIAVHSVVERGSGV